MPLIYPFKKEVLVLLRSLGYKYIVVDETELIVYSLKNPIDKERLEMLNWKQFEIESIKPQDILNSGIRTIEVPENII